MSQLHPYLQAVPSSYSGPLYQYLHQQQPALYHNYMYQQQDMPQQKRYWFDYPSMLAITYFLYLGIINVNTCSIIDGNTIIQTFWRPIRRGNHSCCPPPSQPSSNPSLIREDIDLEQNGRQPRVWFPPPECFKQLFVQCCPSTKECSHWAFYQFRSAVFDHHGRKNW